MLTRGERKSLVNKQLEIYDSSQLIRIKDGRSFPSSTFDLYNSTGDNSASSLQQTDEAETAQGTAVSTQIHRNDHTSKHLKPDLLSTDHQSSLVSKIGSCCLEEHKNLGKQSYTHPLHVSKYSPAVSSVNNIVFHMSKPDSLAIQTDHSIHQHASPASSCASVSLASQVLPFQNSSCASNKNSTFCKDLSYSHSSQVSNEKMSTSDETKQLKDSTVSCQTQISSKDNMGSPNYVHGSIIPKDSGKHNLPHHQLTAKNSQCNDSSNPSDTSFCLKSPATSESVNPLNLQVTNSSGKRKTSIDEIIQKKVKCEGKLPDFYSGNKGSAHKDNSSTTYDSSNSKCMFTDICKSSNLPDLPVSSVTVKEQTQSIPPVINSCNRDTGFLESFRSFVSSSQQKEQCSLPRDDTSQSSFTSASNPGPPPNRDNTPSTALSASSVYSAAGSSIIHELSDDARVTISPAPSNSTSVSGSSVGSAGSGGSPAKLKKTWFQRHSENEDSGCPSLVIKRNSLKNKIALESECRSNSEFSQDVKISLDEKSVINDFIQDNHEIPQEVCPYVSKMEEECKFQKGIIHFKEGGTPHYQEINRGRKSDSSYDIYYKRDKALKLIRQFPMGRRGRKPKSFMRGGLHDSRKRKTPKRIEKPSVAYLKKTGEQFLQDAYCCEVAPKLPKCRECRITLQRSKKNQNIFCRFYAYRKLHYGKNGTILSAGFSEPSDARPVDLQLWLPPINNPPADLNVETSKFLLAHVGDQFCDLVEQEREAQSFHIGEDKTITWKRLVQGVREMCDVCETTLFNFHWVCHRCGFVVCIDCYKAKKNSASKDENSPRCMDEYEWLLCTGRHPHEQDRLMMTQIIASSALWDVAKTLHEVREKWKIPAYCRCIPKEDKSEEKPFSNGICKQLMSGVTKYFKSDKHVPFDQHGKLYQKEDSKILKNSMNGLSTLIKQEGLKGYYNSEIGVSACRWLADVPLDKEISEENREKLKEAFRDKNTLSHSSKCDNNEENGNVDRSGSFVALRDMLIRPSGKGNDKNGDRLATRKNFKNTLDEVVSCVIEQEVERSENKNKVEKTLIHFTRRHPQPHNGRDPLPIRICSLAESMLLYPDIPHSWFCNGRLLLLHDPQNIYNIRLFQEQWKRGQPILVASVSSRLDMSLWHPDGFCRDFGDVRNDLVNCKTGSILPDLPMRKFWEGFENFSKRMRDEDGDYMLLKLKDWPPGEDFSELLPSRFEDLMKVLPLPQYTHRNGVLNLAGRLPECFVRPDLGPKMYNAYGSALYPTKGTTNLHLDISDAVNVMVYVGIPNDGKDEDHIQEALKAIDEGGCDSLMRKRVREKGVKPGALWHIYNARDADKIRDLLNKVAVEHGEKLEPHHDPIHDQSWYLDVELRERLYREYAVEGYAIAQCLGDSVFIPAGAPHQVRNLHSCVKVAEDFVSPENIAHCFTLTQEFRHLSDTHTNHEDKLQIKNIIYHTVKDALALLQANEPTDFL